MSDILLIFTRNPELGKVKTRLAKGVGAENALTIYKTLLEHTKNVVSQINCTKRVGYSVKVRPNDIWEAGIFEKFLQEGEDLGDRMYHAFAKAYQDNYTKVLIVGSDLYDLCPKHIEDAFEALETHDVVIGPAQDGGYYLLGMRSLLKDVFYKKTWGGDTVFETTMKDLEGYSIHQLETLNDIDHAEDLQGYPAFEKYLKD
ncbi:MAG: rSAM/selenodomain-associated transferase 1 [Flavobacteriales bacterium]|jgi:rSAM/selenodomain-associated transferase 1